MPVAVCTASSEDIADLRREALVVLRRRRKLLPVTILERGKRWEIETNDDDFIVSDFSGILTLTEPYLKTYECFYSGCDVPEGEQCDCMEPMESEE